MFEVHAGLLTVDELRRYLARLGVDEQPEPTHANLTLLHRRHQARFPFETLSLHLPELRAPLLLELPALVAKIVDGPPGRGGYCFELNTLFASLLLALGYELHYGAARVLAREQPESDDVLVLDSLAHMILFVESDDGQRVLADVGFGPRGPAEPVPMWPMHEVHDLPPLSHRLRRGAPGWRIGEGKGWYLQLGRDGDWTDLYYFDKVPYFAADFEVLNYYCSHSPEFFATRYPVWCAPLAEGGRIALWGHTLRRYDAEEQVVEELELADLEAVRGALRERCGLTWL